MTNETRLDLCKLVLMAKIVEFQCMNLEDRDPYEIGPD